MFFLLLGLVLLFVIIDQGEKHLHDSKHWIILIICCVTLMIIWSIPFEAGSKLAKEIVTKETITIESNKNNSGVEGTIFFDGGTYYGFTQNNLGGLVMVKIPGSYAVKFEDLNGKTGYVITTKTFGRMPKKWMGLFFINLFANVPKRTEYEIHVPKGTFVLEK